MMKRTDFKKLFTCITCIVLIAAMALLACGCIRVDPGPGETEPSQTQIKLMEGKTYGQGKTQFSLTVVHGDGSKATVTICTDKTLVGEALQELGILSGEEGPYGLYIKTVDGETLDYDTDGMYWSFYVGSDYAITGVDQTAIESGVTYALKAEKA